MLFRSDYKRGIDNYEKRLFIRSEWQGKRLFLRFEGVNSVTNLFINNLHVGYEVTCLIAPRVTRIHLGDPGE